jgi:putative ribosome biogenesis GTPase RsgA
MALMGMTGAGKSTFIQYFTDENVGIGDGLESCKYSFCKHKHPHCDPNMD